MEHIRNQPNNINNYIEEFQTNINNEFKKYLVKIYNEEFKAYDDIINIITQLPLVKNIIDENIMLKQKLEIFEKKEYDKQDKSEIVTLEISDKPIVNSFLDIEKIPYNEEEDDEEEDDEEENDEEVDDNGGGGTHAT